MPLPDEAFEFNKTIMPDRIAADGTVTAIKGINVAQQIEVSVINQSIRVLSIDYTDENTIMRFGADDAERLGVLLQYAAMKARENGEASATAR